MTEYSTPNPQAPDHRPTPTGEPAATRDDSPRVAAAVPITVWRLDDHDHDQPTTDPAAGFASRLARRLVLVYTSRGEAVVDFDHDLHLHQAATTTGRRYLPITDAADLAELGQLDRPIALITLRWPRQNPTNSAELTADMFTGCRLMMSQGASIIAAVRPAYPDEPGFTFATQEHTLRAAAEKAGLAHVLQIVAVSAPGHGDEFLYYASQAEASLATTRGAPVGSALHIDLLVFERDANRDDRP